MAQPQLWGSGYTERENEARRQVYTLREEGRMRGTVVIEENADRGNAG